MSDRNVLFGASLGQWNGADAADAAGRVRLGTQADRDGRLGPGLSGDRFADGGDYLGGEPDAPGRVGGIRAVPLAQGGAEHNRVIGHQQSFRSSVT